MNQNLRPSITVLVVDDDEYILELLKAFFEQIGWRVLTAASAEDALTLPGLEQAQVALLDIQLPGTDGHALQRQLNEQLPDMAKILMSGQADLDDVIAAFSDQAFSFVQKPFSSLKEIAVLVERAVEHKELEVRNREYARLAEDTSKALAAQATGKSEDERKFDRVLSHLYRISPQIALISPADDLLDFVCQALVESGACDRAAITVGDEKFRIRFAGASDKNGSAVPLRVSVRALRGQPLRPFEFNRVEERIGSAIFSRTEQLTGNHVFMPLTRQDGSTFGYLSVESPLDQARPTAELIGLLEVLLAHGAVQLESLDLREELQRRAVEAETLAEERSSDLQLCDERFTRLVQSAADIVYIADEQDRLVFLNQSFTRVLGYVAENYVGRTVRHLLEDLATENPINRRAIQELTSYQYDQSVHHVEILTRQGDKRTLEINRTVIRQGGMVRGTQGLARDITEQRALLQQLVTAERLATTGRIAAGVAHEIKNPLQAMLSQVKTIEQKLATQENPAENLEVVRESIERLRGIVGSMLDLNRTSPSARLPVNLNNLAVKVLALVQQQVREHNVRVQLKLAPDLPLVAGSSQELQQVLLNLILNALEAMPNGGDLIVLSSASSDRVELSVQDSGIGISPEILPQIFEPFFTVRASGAGTGLGLYLTKNIVEMHQGTIAVESEKSRGARFTISFPRA